MGERIVTIAPAAEWYAVLDLGDEGSVKYEPLTVWALVESDGEDGPEGFPAGYRRVIGMTGGLVVGDAEAHHAFVGYAYVDDVRRALASNDEGQPS
jgi:hypothetical protein